MKAKFIMAKVNKSDGTAWLNFHKGLDRKELIDLEGQELELRLPSDLSEYERGLAEGIEIGQQQRLDEFLAWAEEQRVKK